MSVNPKFYFIGDSLTQFGSLAEDNGWLNILAGKYLRKADIINRGFSGYTTEWIKPVFEKIVSEEFLTLGKQVKIITILLGSNDSSLPHTLQHVPLNAFGFNLKFMVESIRSSLPDAAVLLVTPPPIHEKSWHETSTTRYREDKLSRTNENIKRYCDLVISLGQQLNVPVLNLWRVFDGESVHLFNDGLHLSSSGNTLLADQWLDAVDAQFPKLMHTNLPHVFPTWDEVAKRVKSPSL